MCKTSNAATAHDRNRHPGDRATKSDFHNDWMNRVYSASDAAKKLRFISDALSNVDPDKLASVKTGCATIVEEIAATLDEIAEFMDDAEFMIHRLNAPDPVVSETLPNLIEAHKSAHAYFDSVCSLVDEDDPKYDPIYGKEIWNGASAAEDKALLELCRYVPIGEAELKMQARYLAAHNVRNEIRDEWLSDYLSAVARMK